MKIDISKPLKKIYADRSRWRYVVLLVLILSPLAWLMYLDPIPQPLAYHQFADNRPFFGIPNALNILSSLPFLIIGIAGTRFSFNNYFGHSHNAFLVLFVGVGFVCFGSGYYHWSPSNQSLVWDRLPMSFGFMGLFTALLTEHIHAILNRALIPMIILGIGSVLYWHLFDDLRPYIWVQFFPLLVIPFLIVFFPSNYSHQWLLFAALIWYVLAKITEVYDLALFRYTGGQISGHTLKHLFAAGGCFCILLMLQKRAKRANEYRGRAGIT